MQGFVPFVGGSQGNLCLGAPFARLPMFARWSDPGGTASFDLDFAAFPPVVGGWPSPGDTLRFQIWYRDDNPLPTSNLTDGVAITFE